MRSAGAQGVIAASLLVVVVSSRADETTSPPEPLQVITVTAQRLELLGTAATASEGLVNDQELQLAPSTARGNCWRPYRA